MLIAIKENPIDGNEKYFFSSMICNEDWIIDNSFSHYMTSDKRKFIRT